MFASQEYIHRVGRTARGSQGRGHALLFLLPEELGFLRYLKHAKVRFFSLDSLTKSSVYVYYPFSFSFLVMIQKLVMIPQILIFFGLFKLMFCRILVFLTNNIASFTILLFR